jgi:hypothetical protein
MYDRDWYREEFANKRNNKGKKPLFRESKSEKTRIKKNSFSVEKEPIEHSFFQKKAHENKTKRIYENLNRSKKERLSTLLTKFSLIAICIFSTIEFLRESL